MGATGSANDRSSLVLWKLFVVGLPVTIVVASILVDPFFGLFLAGSSASLAASALASASSSAFSQSARLIKPLSPALWFWALST